MLPLSWGVGPRAAFAATGGETVITALLFLVDMGLPYKGRPFSFYYFGRGVGAAELLAVISRTDFYRRQRVGVPSARYARLTNPLASAIAFIG